MKKILVILSGFALLSSCENLKKEHVDLLIHNATIYTVDEDFSTAEAIAIRGDSILEIGAEHQLLNKYQSKQTIDARQQFVYPGFIDGHAHFFGYAKGGAVPMKEQMELFEDGGLMQEGGTVDPVSGNDVPPGSTQEEVRDDIPAQLSEGEFVFPADVVRYIGLENLMRMRQEAKQGLAQMEAMGQMGNSEEAVMPDDLPFDMYDLDIEDEEEYNSETRNYQVGGYVAPPVPFQQQPYNRPTQVNPQTGTYTLPGTGIAGYQVPSGGQTGFTPYGGATPYFQPVQFTGPQFQTSLQTTNLPTFGETVGTRPGQYDELRTYVNDAGQILQIPFKDGQPIYPIPEGYRLQGDQPQAEETPATIPLSTGVRQTDGGGGDGAATTSPSVTGTVTGLTSTASTLSQTGGFLTADIAANANAYAGNAKFGLSNAAMRDATKNLGAYQSATIGAFGMATALGKGLGFMDSDMNDMAKAGQAGKVAALTSMGMARPGQITTDAQATYYGNMINAALDAQKEGLDYRDALAKEMNSPAYAEALQAAATTAMEDVGYSAADLSSPASVSRAIAGYNALASEYEAAANATATGKGVVRDSKGNPVTSTDPVTGQKINVMTAQARAQLNAELEAAATARAKAEALAAQAARAKGNVERGVSTTDAALAKSMADKAFEQEQKAFEAEMAKAGTADVSDASPAPSSTEAGGSGGRGGSEAGDPSGGAGEGSGTDCLTENMKVKLNGVIDFVTNIKVGDLIDGSVVKEVLHKHMRSGYFVINNELEITNDHPVLANGAWTKPEELYIGDYINNVKVESLEYIDRMTPTVSIVIDGDSFDVYTEGNTYTVHGRYREVREQAA